MTEITAHKFNQNLSLLQMSNLELLRFIKILSQSKITVIGKNVKSPRVLRRK